MITIIAGSRGLGSKDVHAAMAKCGWTPTRVISGDARGVDKAGGLWAEEHDIPVVHMPADWNKYGRRAGYLRNVEMAKIAEALVAVWDGSSPGTRHMIEIAWDRGLKVFIWDATQNKKGV